MRFGFPFLTGERPSVPARGKRPALPRPAHCAPSTLRQSEPHRPSAPARPKGASIHRRPNRMSRTARFSFRTIFLPARKRTARTPVPPVLRTNGRTAEQNNVAVQNAVIGRCYVGKRHLSAAAAGAFGDCFGHFFGISRARPIYYVYHTIKSVPLGKNHRYRAATLLMWLRVQGLGFAFTALPVEGEFTGYRFHLFVSPFVPHFMPEYPWLMPGARTQKKRSHGRTRANFDIFCSRKVSVLRIRRRTF